MSFCFNCGAKIQDEDIFCPECGTKLKEAADVQTESEGHCSEQKKDSESDKYGIILTNLPALERKLKTPQRDILSLLNDYISQLKGAGVNYKLVDAADYTFVSGESGMKGKSVHLSNRDPWWEYQRILLDVYHREKNNVEEDSLYLYIIGGNDIVPVPVINNYDCGNRDEDVETDMLYSYPYGPDTQKLLENTQLYQCEMLYLVGRQPIASDTSWNQFVGYMQRALDGAYQGIEITQAYGQSDPHWHKVTAMATNEVCNSGLYTRYKNLSSNYYNGNIILSPEVTDENVSQVYNADAELIYLNLHGNDAPGTPQYLGVSMSDNCYRVFQPQQIAGAHRPNVFVCEACYGAKHVGYDTAHSMLHTAIYNKTLVFLGSSRIAYGREDGKQQVSVGSADVLCGRFVNYLLSGYCSADALFLARSVFFQELPLDPYSSVTLAEFNLYGDPTLYAYAKGFKSSKSVKISKLAPSGAKMGFEVSKIKGGASDSLLEQVRSLVDRNVMDMHDIIAKHLYENYGFTPRQPRTINKISYKDNSEQLCFEYEMPNEGSLVVLSDKNGKIENVLTTK